MTSWGISGLDAAAGSGLPLGSLTMLVEDTPTAHHDAFMRLFVAQGLAHGHAVAVARSTAPASDLFAALPAPRTAPGRDSNVASERQRPPGGEESLRIAWRYAKAKSASSAAMSGVSEGAAVFRHTFDLSETCVAAEDAPVSYLGFGRSDSLREVLSDIQAHVRSAKRKGLFARVAVCCLDPNLWELDIGSLAKFMHLLRVAVERAGAVAVVSVPRTAYSLSLEREADLVLLVDSFNGKGAGVAGLGDEWLGVVSVEKMFRPAGALKCVAGEANIWVFKRGRRKYIFEPAAVAPDAEDGGDDMDSVPGQKPSSRASEGLCAPGPQASKYDF